jgi:hypothetical protein
VPIVTQDGNQESIIFSSWHYNERCYNT